MICFVSADKINHLLIDNIKRALFRYKLFGLEKNIPLIITIDFQKRNPLATSIHRDSLVIGTPIYSDEFQNRLNSFIYNKLLLRETITDKFGSNHVSVDRLSDYVIIDYIGDYVSAHYIPNNQNISSGMFTLSTKPKKMFRTMMKSSGNRISTYMFNNVLGEHCTPDICVTDSCAEEIKICREKGNKEIRKIREDIDKRIEGVDVIRYLRRYEYKFINHLIGIDGQINPELLEELSGSSTLFHFSKESLDLVQADAEPIEKIIVPESMSLIDFIEHPELLKHQFGGLKRYNDILNKSYYEKYLKYKNKYLIVKSKFNN